MNPLIQNKEKKYDTKLDTAPFSKIKNEHFAPAFIESIAKTKAEIDEIVNSNEKPTFENVIEKMTFSGENLDRISSIFFNLNSAETSEELQKIAQEITPLLVSFQNDIVLNPLLFDKVKSVYKQRDSLNLSLEQTTLLEKTYKNFSRNGANLTDDKKEKLREIDTELARLSLKFGENVLAETQNFQLHITTEKDLSGLPEDSVEAASALAKKNGKEGWIFTLDQPSYIPFITYNNCRELRKKMVIAFGARGFQDNKYNNETIVLKIIHLRFERAQLLGYQTYAHFVLQERMAENPEKVFHFLNDLSQKAKTAAEKEFKELREFAKKTDGIEILEKWDGAYYSEKLKQQLFDFDEEKLKPYFQLEKVVEGVFVIAKKLYNLSFVEVFDIDKYHNEVKTYQVTDDKNQFTAVFYADFFPRTGKRNGAWMTSFKNQAIKNNTNERPHISIVCNFTRPTETKPSLLTFNEVTTLFHEFGHALHGILANTTYPSLSGTNVFWDFVELPSQILENWCYEPEALSIFAHHYKTGEIIPTELISKIKESSNFQEGLATLRQLSLGLLDMGWHTKNPAEITDLKSFEEEQFSLIQLYPDIKENAVSTAFSHVFQGGYAAGYYSYKWAEVLDADAFDFFKENGIFNQEVAIKFKENILSKGGTEHPQILYKRFRGKEPKPDALLKRAGLSYKYLEVRN